MTTRRFCGVKNYEIGLLKGDIVGGISVAALSIPIAVAFAEVAGLPPEAGLHTAVLALLAYFILGGSSRTIIGTDFPTVALFAATVTATFGSDRDLAPQFMTLVVLMTGVLMFVAGLLKLGLIGNFLSKPIMLGYLNGVSIVLIESQLDELTGLNMEQTRLFSRILEVFEKAELINLPTLLLGVISILALFVSRRISGKVPFQLVLLIVTPILAKIFDFGSFGIALMPEIQNPYPTLRLPDLQLLVEHFPDIFLASAAIVFVSFLGEIPVAQAVSKGEKFDPNKEFYALGLAHLAIGFAGGYPVSGDDSRTAANVAVGGQTKLVNLIAVAVMLLTVLLTPGVFRYVPLVTIAAIIIFAGIGMFERGAGLAILRSDKGEFLVFAVCILGVLILGVYQGILFAMILAILQLVKKSSRPYESESHIDPEEKFGSVSDYPSDSDSAPDGEVLIYRFDSALLFYNADYFVERLSRRAESKANLNLIIIDARPINIIDLTAVALLKDLIREFNSRGISVVFAGANESFRNSLTRELQSADMNPVIFYPSIHSVYRQQ